MNARVCTSLGLENRDGGSQRTFRIHGRTRIGYDKIHSLIRVQGIGSLEHSRSAACRLAEQFGSLIGECACRSRVLIGSCSRPFCRNPDDITCRPQKRICLPILLPYRHFRIKGSLPRQCDSGSSFIRPLQLVFIYRAGCHSQYSRSCRKNISLHDFSVLNVTTLSPRVLPDCCPYSSHQEVRQGSTVHTLHRPHVRKHHIR